MLIFEIFLVIHITLGTIGLVSFWVPVFGRKGAEAHKKWGRVFAWTIMVTGLCAIGMSTCSLLWPLETHPKLTDVAMVRGMFGWMMLYLAILTVSLVWHGLKAVEHKAAHASHRRAFPIALQLVVIVAAINCGWQGYLINQPLMMAMPGIGIASAVTNLWFIATPQPWRLQYLIEHFKALVGAGISVYTAFLAFGAVRLMPQNAFHPALWAAPCTIGLSIIVWHWWKTRKLKKIAMRVRNQDATAAVI
jgi:hypothetical protein